MQKNLNNIKAVLFDLDGVLIDAVDFHFQAFNKALSLFGFGMSEEEHMKNYNGLPTKVKLQKMTDIPSSLHGMIAELKAKYTLEYIEQTVKPSHEKLLMLFRLKKLGIKLACCSNATSDSVHEMLRRAGMLEFFDLILGNTSGYAPKPSPAIYLGAMKVLKVAPEECVIVEDAPVGIEAARASGGIVVEVAGVHNVNFSLFETL